MISAEKTTACQRRKASLLERRRSSSWMPKRTKAPIQGPQTVPTPPIRQMMIICRLLVTLKSASASVVMLVSR